jgi:hypothetical protein
LSRPNNFPEPVFISLISDCEHLSLTKSKELKPANNNEELTNYEQKILKLVTENNALIKENNRVMNENNAILRDNHELMRKVEDYLRGIKSNTSTYR